MLKATVDFRTEEPQAADNLPIIGDDLLEGTCIAASAHTNTKELPSVMKL